MRGEITRDFQIRRSSIALWSAILSGPIAFAVALELRYALVQWACRNNESWVLTAIAGALLLLPVGGAIICWGYSPAADEDRVGSRIHFMAIAGFILNCAFVLAIIANAIPTFIFRACQ